MAFLYWKIRLQRQVKDARRHRLRPVLPLHARLRHRLCLLRSRRRSSFSCPPATPSSSTPSCSGISRCRPRCSTASSRGESRPPAALPIDSPSSSCKANKITVTDDHIHGLQTWTAIQHCGPDHLGVRSNVPATAVKLTRVRSPQLGDRGRRRRPRFEGGADAEGGAGDAGVRAGWGRAGVCPRLLQPREERQAFLF